MTFESAPPAYEDPAKGMLPIYFIIPFSTHIRPKRSESWVFCKHRRICWRTLDAGYKDIHPDRVNKYTPALS
jgi:hypothetical protein